MDKESFCLIDTWDLDRKSQSVRFIQVHYFLFTNMKKRKLHLFILIACLSAVTACSKTESSSMPVSSNAENAYVEGEDYNPTLYSEMTDHSLFAETEDGVLFIAGDYLFYASGEDMSVRPLCFKTECLHLEETDATKIPQCNAFLGSSALPFVSVYKDSCYVTSVNRSNGSIDLVKMNLDGSERKTLIEDVQEKGIYDIIMHRGVIYCMADIKTAEGDHLQQIQAMSADAKKKKLVTIYEINGDELSLASLLPYENYIYFYEMSGMGTDDIAAHSKRWNIQTGQVEEVSNEAAIPAGVKAGQVIFRGANTADYWQYLPDEGTMEQEKSGIQSFISEHPYWNCHLDSADDEIMAFLCYDREHSDFVPDLIITDAEGHETAVLANEAWGLARSAIVTLGEQKYLIHISAGLQPFSVDAYQVADLLQGIVEPVHLLNTPDYDSLCPGFAY